MCCLSEVWLPPPVGLVSGEVGDVIASPRPRNTFSCESVRRRGSSLEPRAEGPVSCVNKTRVFVVKINAFFLFFRAV